MIPSLNADGYLPPGIHSATLGEIELRFGHDSELRRVQMELLRWLIEPGFPSDPAAAAELLSGLPFIKMELVDREAFDHFTQKTYATDRNLVTKGMVEVIP